MSIVKIELEDINSYFDGEASVCQLCLCSDRELRALDEHIDIYTLICDTYNMLTKQIFICWECNAILHKFKLFQAQVKEAQRVFNCHYLNKENLYQVKPLSKLSKSGVTCTDNANPILKEEKYEAKIVTVIKPEEIKQENLQNEFLIKLFDITKSNEDFKEEITLQDDLVDTFSDTDDKYAVEPPQIKEKKPVYKRKKRSKPQHFKIVYGDKVIDKESVIEKFEIKPNEIERWKQMKPNKNCNFQKTSLVHYGYRCRICGVEDISMTRMNTHRTKHASVKCVYCEMTLPNILSVTKHVKQQHSVFTCHHCEKTCKSLLLLERHIVATHMSHVCSICKKQLPSKKALYRHFERNHTKSLAENCFCAPCGIQFKNESCYRGHLKHSVAHALDRNQPFDKKVVPCPKCEKMFTRLSYMKNHYRYVHEHSSTHVCTMCNNKQFLNKTKLVNHIKYFHEKLEKIRDKYCDLCGKAFHSNTLLKIHMSTHTGEKPHKCENCFETFQTKTKLVAHIKQEHL